MVRSSHFRSSIFLAASLTCTHGCTESGGDGARRAEVPNNAVPSQRLAARETSEARAGGADDGAGPLGAIAVPQDAGRDGSVTADTAQDKVNLTGKELPDIGLAIVTSSRFAPREHTRRAKGEPWYFREARGQVLVLEFFGTWCAHCPDSLRRMQRLYDRFKTQGLLVVGVDVPADEGEQYRESEDAAITVFLTENGVKFPVLTDSQSVTYRVLQVGWMPDAILVDRHGVIRHMHISLGAIEQEVESLLGEP